MSVMGRGGDNISKKVDDGIKCFAYKPNSYYSFNIFNASDKSVSDALKKFNRGDLASGNNRVLYIDKKQSGTGQYHDYMYLQTQGYIDFREHYNKIKDAKAAVDQACKKDLIEDSSYSFEKLYHLLVGASVAEGLATGLSAASMAMSAASSAKTGQLMDDLGYLNKHETQKPQSKIELLQELAKAKLLKLVMTTSNYLSATGDNTLYNDV